jgi:hypothetical protein
MASIPIKQIGQGGMITDIPEYALPPNQISTAFNIRYENGVPARCKGWKQLPLDMSAFSGYKFVGGAESINNEQSGIVFALTSAVMAAFKIPIIGRRKDTFPSLLSTGDMKMIFYDGLLPAPLDISPDYGSITNFKSLDWSAIYGAVIMNTQEGVPYIYAESDDRFRQLGRWIECLGPDAACNIFTNFKNFYVALNMKEKGQLLGNKIRWSGVIEPPITAGAKDKFILTTTPANTPLNTLKFTIYVGRDYPLPPLTPVTLAKPINFWINTTTTAGLGKPIFGNGTETAYEIMVASTATAIQVATATANIINSTGFFTASNIVNSIATNQLTISNKNPGLNKPPVFTGTGYVGWSKSQVTDATLGNDPTWDEADLNALAGFMFLPDDTDAIVSALKLSDKLMVYTMKATYAMSFVGGSYVFSIAKVFMDDGCCSQFGVQEFDGKHFVVGRSDIFIHDGNSKKSIVSGRIKEYFYSSIKDLELIKTFKNALTQDIFVYYSHEPEAIRDKNYDRAWVYNYRDDAWSIIELPKIESMVLGPSIAYINTSYDISTDTWDSVASKSWSDYSSSLIASRFYFVSYFNNKVYLGDEGSQRDFVDYPAYVGRGHIDLDELYKSNYPVKYIKQILPSMQGEGLVSFDFSISRAPLDSERPVTSVNNVYLGEKEFNLSTEQYKIDTQFSGRYFSYRVTMNTKGSFKIHEMELNLEARGMR